MTALCINGLETRCIKQYKNIIHARRLSNGNPSSTTNSALPKDHTHIGTMSNDTTRVVIPEIVKGTALEKYFVRLDAQRRRKLVDILHGKRSTKDKIEEVPLVIETIDNKTKIKRIFRMYWDNKK
eukprot:927756_1